MEKILIVGKKSLIGQALYKFINCDIVSYNDIKKINFKNYDVVVNCALNPLSKTNTYDEKNDVDYEIAVKANSNNCHYVMLSTRKIYGSSTVLKKYTEESEENPYDYYSENKLKSEKKILSQFGDKATIVRGSNVFGYEPGRNSMMGYFLNHLGDNGVIKYDILSTTSKDIIHVGDAVQIISKICYQKPLGIYNMGTSFPYTMLNVGIFLLDGFNNKVIENRMKFEGEFYGEQFVLDTTKICSTLNIETPSVQSYHKIISDIGSKFRESIK